MNEPVSLELAKLLSLKGFNEPCRDYYNMINYDGEWKLDTELWPFADSYYPAPTIADVVMWIYKKHGIWIEVYYDNSRKEFYTVLDGEECKFDIPSEAYEAAINYILTKVLID